MMCVAMMRLLAPLKAGSGPLLRAFSSLSADNGTQAGTLFGRWVMRNAQVFDFRLATDGGSLYISIEQHFNTDAVLYS